MEKTPQNPPQNPDKPERPDDEKKPTLEIYLVPRQPEYELECMTPGSEEATMLIDVRHDLTTSQDAGYAVFANMMNTRKLISEDGEAPKTIAMIKNTGVGEFTLGINFEVYKRLSHAARKEILKGQMLRIPYGHFSERATRVVEKFGLEIATRAAQIVLSQIINPAILAEEGIILPVPEMWEFERNLGWEEYCELLWDAGGGGGSMPGPIKIEIYDPENGNAPAKTDSNVPQDLKDLLEQLKDENGLTRLDMVVDAKFGNGGELDSASRDFLSAVNDALGSMNSSLKSQGFISGEAEQFIEALNRPPRVSWQQYLRGMYGKYKSRRRRKTRNRPSRHCFPYRAPSGKMVEHYKGRIRKPQPFILFVVDTSGSMGANELRCVDAELKALKNKGATIMVLQIDADVAKPPDMYNGRQKFEQWAGRGGTSFQPGFDFAHELSPRPDFLVYFTDGYDYQGLKYESEIPTLWVLTSTGTSIAEFRKNVCSWGEVCKIDVDDASSEAA